MIGVCDRCGLETEYLAPFPFVYMMNGKYVTYQGCRRCRWEEDHKKNAPKEMKP